MRDDTYYVDDPRNVPDYSFITAQAVRRVTDIENIEDGIDDLMAAAQKLGAEIDGWRLNNDLDHEKAVLRTKLRYGPFSQIRRSHREDVLKRQMDLVTMSMCRAIAMDLRILPPWVP